MTLESTTDITSLSHDGRGIAIVNNKTTFISGALAQEKVTYQLTKKHSRYNEGIAKTILNAAPTRTLPQCEHFAICGGCSLQHMENDAQIQFKEKVLLEQLKHFGQVTPKSILPPLTANPWGYRRKARLGVRFVKKKNRLLVGFREKFSNYLADIQNCPVLHPSVGSRIQLLSALIASLTQYDAIAQIEVAVSDHETALVFRHLTDLPEEDLEKLRAFSRDTQIHIYLQPNAPAIIHKLWPNDNNERLRYSIPDYQLEIQFHPLDFKQINSEIKLQMIKQALTLLDLQPTEQALDLFCGLGNFTLPMACQTAQVTGVEGEVLSMVERAKNNAQLNQIAHVDFYADNLMQPNTSAPWATKKYDKILLDPPRTGAKEILPLISRFSAKRIVYVSCNPATLARDAKELVHTYGYQLEKIGLINMFPHTSHIEAIALFRLHHETLTMVKIKQKFPHLANGEIDIETWLEKIQKPTPTR